MKTIDPRKRAARLLLLTALVLPAACGTRLDTSAEQATGATTGVTDAGQPAAPAPGDTAAAPVQQPTTGTTPQAPTTPTGGTKSPPKTGSAGQGGNAGAGSGPAGSNAPASCTGTLSTINIGSVGEFSGLAGAALLNGITSVQAWVQSVNAKGGIQCHPLKLITVDDGGDPAKNQSATRQLVERDKVIAMVHQSAPLAGSPSQQYLTQKQIPTIGGSGTEPGFYNTPMNFPQASEPDAAWIAAYSALGNYAKALGTTDVGLVYCVETPICAAVGQLAKTEAPKAGVKMTYVNQATVVQPDYTSVCLSAQKAKAAILWYVMDSNSGLRLARSCDSVGYHPKYFAIGIHTAPSMAGIPAFDGLGSMSPVLPYMVTSNPSIARYHAVMKQYGAGAEPDSIGILGWSSAMLLQSALAQATLSAIPTAQEILNGLYALKKDDLGGLTYPLTFKRGEKPPQVVCGWSVTLKSGTWSSPNGTKPVVCE